MIDNNKIVACISFTGIILGLIIIIVLLNFYFEGVERLEEWKEFEDELDNESDDQEKTFIQQEIESQERFINNIILGIIAAIMFTFVSIHLGLVYYKK